MLRLSHCLRVVVKNDHSNYRLISLLTSFFKNNFKKIILFRLNQHILNHNILVSEQFGFRCQSSSIKASHALFNAILEALNKQNTVGGMFCDLKMAFDSVNHDILLRKLQFYGIGGKFQDLIVSYLSNKYQSPNSK
jgi:hypothetical protein